MKRIMWKSAVGPQSKDRIMLEELIGEDVELIIVENVLGMESSDLVEQFRASGADDIVATGTYEFLDDILRQDIRPLFPKYDAPGGAVIGFQRLVAIRLQFEPAYPTPDPDGSGTGESST